MTLPRYARGSLKWDSATGIDANGVACLSLFDIAYENVRSDDGDKLVAPGTSEQSVIRLKNGVSGHTKALPTLLFDANRAVPDAKRK